MADKNKGAKHLTDLTLGIDGIREALQEAQTLIEKKSMELGNVFAENFKKASNTNGVAFNFGMDEKATEQMRESIQDFTNDMGKRLSDSVKLQNDKVTQLSETYRNAQGTKTKLTLQEKKGELQMTEEIRRNTEKEAEYYKKRQKAAQDFYNFYNNVKSTSMSRKEEIEYNEYWNKRIDAEEAKIAKKREARRAKEIAGEKAAGHQKRKIAELNYSRQITQLEQMISKQKEFTKSVEGQKFTFVNQDIIDKSKKYTRILEKIQSETLRTGKTTQQQANHINFLKKKIAELGVTYETSGAKGQSFFRSILDKAKWLSAFYIVDGMKRAFIESAKVIKETEDAVVQLQRVLNEDIGQTAISKQLYDISYEFGRSFNDVQEIAVRFAQTGATWSEVTELTKSAMLALNTAELDVQQSTEGLIAIMSQWNVEAKDMEAVIDKINITADKFPVTSEKIIAALQRASSSAKNANLSMEETIGVITALSKATGRSGSVIGTALNSLVIYTSKTKALETFYEVGNETVKKTVTAYKNGSATILDVWRALSDNLAELNEKQQAALLAGVDTNELGMHLEQEAAGITEDIKKIYGSAGTFRQNYLVALLNDIDTVDEVTQNMANSTGYSVRENEKYMKTLSAQIEQFVAAWKELIVNMGEGNLGLGNTMKLFVSLGTVFAKVIKYTGGLNNTLSAVLSVLIMIKAKKINEVFVSWADGIKTVSHNMSAMASRFKLARKNGKSFTESLKLMGTAAETTAFKIGALQLALTALVAVYSLVSSAVRKANQVAEEKRQKNIENAQAEIEEAKATRELYQEFEKLYNTANRTDAEQEKFEKTTARLAKSLELTAYKADGTRKSFSDLAEEIRNASAASFDFSEAEWSKYLGDLEKEFENAGKKEGLFGAMENELQIFTGYLGDAEKGVSDFVYKYLGEFAKTDSNNQNVRFFAPDKGQEKEYFEAQMAVKDYLDEISNTVGLTPELQEFYNELSNNLQKTEEQYKALVLGMIEYQTEQDRVSGELPKTSGEYEKYKNELLEVYAANDALKPLVGELVDSLFPELAEKTYNVAESALNAEQNLKDLKTAFDKLNKSVDKTQGNLQTAFDAINEYNNTGYLSVDTIQALVAAGNEYIGILDFTENGVRVNEKAVADLINTQRTNVLEMIKQAAAADMLKLAQKYLSEQTDETATSSDGLGVKLNGLESDIVGLTNQLLTGTFTLAEYNNQMSILLGKNDVSNFDTYGFMKDAEEIYKNYNNLYQGIQNNIGKVDQYIGNSGKKQAEYYEQQKKAVKDRYDAEIDKLKELQEENSRLDKQEDYLKKKREAEKDIDSASVRSGIEYREKEEEARQKLDDIETDWQKTIRDWGIDDRIKALEKMRDAEIDAIDKRIAAQKRLSVIDYNSISQRIAGIDLEEEKEKESVVRRSETKKGALTEFKNVFEGNFNSILGFIEKGTSENSKKVYQTYKEQFINPMTADLIKVATFLNLTSTKFSKSGFEPKLPTWLPNSAFGFGRGGYNDYTQNTYNNNNQSNNMYANFWGGSSSTSAYDFFFKP